MCGIFGFNFEDKSLLKKGMKILEHRGPDDSGSFIDKNVSLGHRRLSIIDLSRKGHQPMQYNDLTIIYNGEIYNFKELKNDLKADYKTNSDTEVILKYYQKYGEKCLDYFNGMFAFCIYDSKKKILFLARDRIGVKPLYYYFKDGKFIFASEIKAILQDEIKREINFEAMNDYFTYFYVPYPKTIFKDVYKLEPGHYLIFDLKKKKITKEKYWDINFAPINKPESYFRKRLVNEFKEAVKRHLISDVPVGAYLSGGIDSSSITAMMSNLSDNITTYSVGFDSNTVVNELDYARKVAEKLNTNHHEIIVTGEDALKIIEKVIYHLDEPIVNAASIPLYYMSKAAKKDMTVVLTGNGGDELFAGYQQHKVVYYTSFLKNFNYLINNPINRNILKLFDNKYAKFSLKYIKAMDNLPEAYKTLMYYKAFTEEDKENLILNYKKIKPVIESFFKTEYHLINQLTMIDLKLLLPENYLMVDDKINMANSLESRVPFLDYKFVEFASKIPPKLKLKGLTGKYIIKKTMKELLPKEILKRKKMGFTPPLRYWIDYGFKDMAKNIYQDKELSRLFNKTYLEKSLQQSNKIFPLLTFGLWHEKFTK